MAQLKALEWNGVQCIGCWRWKTERHLTRIVLVGVILVPQLFDIIGLVGASQALMSACLLEYIVQQAL